MSRSSILNFKSLVGVRLRVPWTPIAVVAGLFAFELCVRAIPDRAILPVASRQGEIAFMEEKVLPHFPTPRAIFLGSSRIRRAIVPKQLDTEMDWPPNSTVNLGLAMARVFECLALYKRSEAQFKNAKYVILNVDEWHLSTGPKLSNTLYELEAPLLERFRLPPEQRVRSVLDGVFTFRLKTQLLPNLIARHKNDVQTLELTENNQVLAPASGTHERLNAIPEQVALFYERFDISEVLKDHVRELARRVKANGGTFILMETPNRSDYQTEVERHHAADYEAQQAAFALLAAELNVDFYSFYRPNDLGLTDDDYEDYGHISPAGAKKVTHFVAELLKGIEARPTKTELPKTEK